MEQVHLDLHIQHVRIKYDHVRYIALLGGSAEGGGGSGGLPHFFLFSYLSLTIPNLCLSPPLFPIVASYMPPHFLGWSVVHAGRQINIRGNSRSNK